MLTRCYNPNTHNYHRYGGRGIEVCDRWKNSFNNFYDDMIQKYNNKLTLDRIDINGNYCKENCRWATVKEQNNNTSTNHRLTYNGETLNIGQWEERLGLKQGRIHNRMNKHGWSLEKALTTK
jgi:hypothetical protein